MSIIRYWGSTPWISTISKNVTSTQKGVITNHYWTFYFRKRRIEMTVVPFRSIPPIGWNVSFTGSYLENVSYLSVSCPFHLWSGSDTLSIGSFLLCPVVTPPGLSKVLRTPACSVFYLLKKVTSQKFYNKLV